MNFITKFLARIFILSLFPFLGFAQQSKNFPFNDAKLPIEKRLDDVIKRLTIDEKIGMLSETSAAVERLGIDKYFYGNEGLHGVMRPGKFTVFPQSIALAASWNPTLINSVATAISDEARGKWNELNKGKNQNAPFSDLLTLWSPTINMARDPRWGRTAETYGEDPFLTSRFAVAYIKGLQGNDPNYIKVVATPKHLAANNEENNRLSANSIVSEKTLREYYLPAFKSSVVEGNAQSIMSSYNKVNWIPSTASKWLLTDVLRKEWGFDGYVVSDCGAACNIFTKHQFTASMEEAAAAALKAGMDMECAAGCNLIKEYLKLAWQKKLVTDEELNNSVRNVLRVRIRLGLFDKTGNGVYDNISPKVIGSEEHQKLALKAAQESIVLLKNNKNILPLKLSDLKSIAVVGHNADINVFGGYSGVPVNTPITPLQGIKNAVGDAVKINYAPTKLDLFNVEMIPSDELQAANGQHGLDAEYFDNKFLEGTPKKRIDPQVNFNTKENPPDPFIPAGKKSMRWTGWLVPSKSGEYTLAVSSDDGSRAWFDGKQVTNSWKDRGEILDSFRVTLVAGKKYAVKIEYYDTGNDAVCRFWWRTPFAKDKVYTAQIDAAKKSDVVVAVIGSGLYNEREGHDKENLELPGDQMAMLKAVYQANPNVVVVMVTGSQHTICWIKENIPGIVNIYFGGEQAGNAIASVLFGKYNPSGKLPLTYYESLDKVPAMNRYEINEGRTYMYYPGKPLYEFGYGLSYTTFKYENLQVKRTIENGKKQISVEVEIVNTGNIDGEEVVQLYTSYPDSQHEVPLKQLKGFKKVFVARGQKTKVDLKVNEDDISFWSIEKGWQPEQGKVMINVGSSSKDIRLNSVVDLSK
ncbi:glycoside hydrolase family 3 protein [Pedobacter jejuensis]|uniref:Glycoside hydrolase family 3 protein n=1 Tax=Pedobacter jejuensis TaxID=1268550 RepID=A0A3N0C2A5_9SPHI|nr:glycoside hydrolase family 3 protein [Pedobacter jejuensis]RNL56556.1 glycoside hydrolase family 3 protein [Pedobacter jejuensis]